MTLDSKVSILPLVGPSQTLKLEKLSIRTIKDLLYYIPFRYDDFSQSTKIADLVDGTTVTVRGIVLKIANQFTPRFILQKATIQDDTGELDVIWFNQRFIPKTIHPGDVVSLSGKIKLNGRKLSLQSPKYEIIKTTDKTIHTGRLVPIYSESQGITSKWLRARMKFLTDTVKTKAMKIDELLPDSIQKENNLLPLATALSEVHFPTNLESAERAKHRLAFDELLEAHIESLIRRENVKSSLVGNKLEVAPHIGKILSFSENLPFKLTNSQKTVLEEILSDLGKSVPMNRLLQGDVGSGKTVVATLAMLVAHLNGFESVLMAPTEILAQQHFETITKMLSGVDLKVGIATGSQKNWQNCQIVVGTHALLNDKINFKKLGLVVIDEQHRFGVNQRLELVGKGINPHILTMTATPIPRTIALSLYGDLDLSVITEIPKGRLPVKTRLVTEQNRQKAYDWAAKIPGQMFVICPLIDTSETLESVKSAKSEFERIKKDIFPKKKIALLHGRMTGKDKQKILSDFKSKKYDILVATPVVEVGIDIPNATVMIIEGAERFGLAALHQLRGRVGRGALQSFCLLFTSDGGDNPRLRFMEKMNNGLDLAEIDLKFRGPGQRFGTAQHGSWDLKIADFSDLELIRSTRKLAETVFDHPEIFPLLRKVLVESKISATRG